MQEAPVLRPLSVGDIIDRVLRLIRANIVLFIGIALIPDLILEILQRVSGLSQTLDPNDLRVLFDPQSAPVSPRQFQPPNTGAVIAVVIVSIAVSLIQAGALIQAIGQRYLGRTITVREAYERGLRAAPRLVLSALVVVVVFTAVILVIVAGVALLNASAGAGIALALVGIVGFFFVLPWAFLSLTVVGPAIVLEGLGPIAAIRRSFHLMDKARLRALGLYILVWIISIILGIVLGIVFLVSFVTDPAVRSVLQVVASVVSSVISSPLLYGAAVVLFYDLRVRKEAFDLQLAAEALPREG